MVTKRHAVDISKLRKRITIQSHTQVSDGQGGRTLTWTDLITVWASLEPVSKRELIYTQSMQYRRTHKIIIRSSETTRTITNAMRIKYGDRTFQVKGDITPDERNFYLFIDCEENVGG